MNLNEASYEIYESDASATITPYAIGDEIACWDYKSRNDDQADQIPEL